MPTTSKILEGYHTLTPSGFHPMGVEFQAILVEADKGKKGGKGSKKATKTYVAKEGHFEASYTKPKKATR